MAAPDTPAGVAAGIRAGAVQPLRAVGPPRRHPGDRSKAVRDSHYAAGALRVRLSYCEASCTSWGTARLGELEESFTLGTQRPQDAADKLAGSGSELLEAAAEAISGSRLWNETDGGRPPGPWRGPSRLALALGGSAGAAIVLGTFALPRGPLEDALSFAMISVGSLLLAACAMLALRDQP